MLAEPYWLNADEIEDLNRLIVASTAEPHVVLSRDGLEAAADSPRNRFLYDGGDLLTLSVRLMFSVGTAHAFGQGNKRTAFFGAVLFIENNGGAFVAPDMSSIGEWVEALVEHKLSESDLVTLLRPYVVP